MRYSGKLKGEISINTLIAILLGFIVLSIIVILLITWKDRALEIAGGIFNVKVTLPF